MDEDGFRQHFLSAGTSFGLRGGAAASTTSPTSNSTSKHPQQQQQQQLHPGMAASTGFGDDASGFPLLTRRPSASIMTSPALRRPSMLGLSMQLNSNHASLAAGVDSDSDSAMRDDTDSPMLLGSPIDSFEVPAYPPLTSAGLSRRRSASGSDMTTSNTAAPSTTMSTSLPYSSANVPPSPLSVARALQEGQRTPPPFLQRRLYNESSSSAPQTASTATPAAPVQHHFPSGSNSGSGGEESSSNSASNSQNGSSFASGAAVVRRPIHRRPNLLPKPKSHLRVLSQLRQEDQPGDSLEIASEATLHKLARSQASTLPPTKNHSSAAGQQPQHKSTPNRYPETAEDDVFDRPVDDESSNDDDDGNGSEFGMSVGYATEDEEERKAVMWTGIRSGGSTPSALLLGKSPGSEKAFSRMEVEIPSTPSWQAGSRPGKRKLGEERFEPYSQAFKRRAVSPASSNHFPTPPSLNSLPATLPISMPSPTLGPVLSSTSVALWNATGIMTGSISGASAGSRSRGGSPVPSLSSSAGTRMSYLMRDREREDKEREKLESLGKMSLG